MYDHLERLGQTCQLALLGSQWLEPVAPQTMCPRLQRWSCLSHDSLSASREFLMFLKVKVCSHNEHHVLILHAFL